MVLLTKRGWFFWDDDDGSSGWYTWGRWVLLGVIIAVAIISFIFLQMTSCRRARHGQRPIRGTAWMVPPSYYQATQQNPNDAVPVYRQKAGEGDAGYYDPSGNFVPLQNMGGADASYTQYVPHPGYAYTGREPSAAAQQYYPPPSGPPPGRQPVDSKTPHAATMPV